MVGIIALVVSLVALLLGIVALVKASDLREDLNRQKRLHGELSDTLKTRLESLAKTMTSRESPFAPASQRSTPPASQKSAPPASPSPQKSAPPPPAPEPVEEQFINFDCSHCNQNIDAPAAMAGYHVSCPTCSTLITVPLESSSAAAARAAAREENQPVIGDDVDMEEEVLKGATVRIDISKVFEEMEPPKRQIVIKRRG